MVILVMLTVFGLGVLTNKAPSMVILVMLTVFGLVLAQEQEPKVTVHFTQRHAHKGDNVTFECRVQNKGSGVVAIGKELCPCVYQPTYVMHTERGRLGSRQEQIATNDFLYPNYKATNRHELRRIATGGSVDLYFLHIYNVNHEDTAKYHCSVIGTQSVAATEFQVFKRPSEVGFQNHSNGDVMVFEEGRPRRLLCYANDVVPLPAMSIHVESHDYTRQFQVDTAIDPQCYHGHILDGGCVLHYAYNKSLHHPAFEPDYYDHGKKLICNVTVPLAHYPDIVSSVTINVLFSPKFNCTQFYRATLHAQNFMMTCRVMYNPPLIDGVTLSAFDGGLNIRSGFKREGITLSEHILSSTEREVTINIDDVMGKHFGAYKLRAANNRGSNTAKLILQRAGYDFRNAASRAVTSPTTLLLLLLLLFTSHH